MNRPRLIIFSGINVGLTSAVCRRVTPQIPKWLGIPEDHLEYVGNPFRGWPHPLQWPKNQRMMDPRARLFTCWGRATDHLTSVVDPVLRQGKIAVGQRLGFDVVAYSTARMPSEGATSGERRRIHDLNVQTEHIHHQTIVPLIVKHEIQEIPQYVIPIPNPATITEEWIRQSPSLLKEVDVGTIRDFVAYEIAVMNRYFDPRNGQRPPIYLRATSVEEMVEEALMGLRSIFNQSSSAVA